jgi:redox-sensing transcriptional repressor
MNDFDQTYLDTAERRDDDPTATGRLGVSPAVIKRLPRYYRYLREPIRQDKLRISSSELSRMMNVTASQIRQDFNCFGGFGQQGYGYNVKYLYLKISEILGVSRHFTAVIIGAGNLGRALGKNPMFAKRGVIPTAMFDVDPATIGRQVGDLTVLPMDKLEEYLAENHTDLAVLTLPKECAAEAAHRLATSGVKGLWNFTGSEFALEEFDVRVENVHLGDSLMTLCYELNLMKTEEERKAEKNQ